MYQSDDELFSSPNEFILSKYTTTKLMPRAATTVHFVIRLNIHILYFVSDISITKIPNFNVNYSFIHLIPTSPLLFYHTKLDFYPILSHSVSQTVHTQCVHC